MVVEKAKLEALKEPVQQSLIEEMSWMVLVDGESEEPIEYNWATRQLRYVQVHTSHPCPSHA